MKTLLHVLLALLLVGSVTAEQKQYDGYKVFQIQPKNENEVKDLQNIMQNLPKVDFWKEPSDPSQSVVFMVPPKLLKTTFAQLREASFNHWITLDIDVQKQIDEEGIRLSQWATNMKAAGKPLFLDLDQFHSYEDVMDYLDHVIGNCAAGLTSTVNIAGHSKGGRDLKTLTLSTAHAANKPIYITERMAHAREWISVSSLLKVINHMCYDYGSDATVTHLLDTYDFVFLPIQDPDGYEFTRSHDRLSNMWRNRHGVDSESSCVVIDANKNYDWQSKNTKATCSAQCTAQSQCNGFQYCSPSYTCCDPDDGDVCERHCMGQSDCSDFTYCSGKYYMCCDPPPDMDCEGQCWGQSECSQFRYCSGTYALCCLPPPDMDCERHCYYQSECMDSHYCNGTMAICCRPPPEEDCAGHCFYESDCYGSYSCSYEYGMCCYKADHEDADVKDDQYPDQYSLCIEIKGHPFILDPSEIQPSYEQVWDGMMAAIEETEN